MILNVSGAVQQEISTLYQFLYDGILVVFFLMLSWFQSLVILEMLKFILSVKVFHFSFLKYQRYYLNVSNNFEVLRDNN